MHIVPIVNYYQRTEHELAEDPTSTVDAYMWFMRKDEITLRALPEGFHQFLRGTELVIDREYNQASVDHALTIPQITTGL